MLRSPPPRLLGSLTRPLREWIDAPPGGCDHEMSFPFCACWRGTSLHTGDLHSGNDGSHSKIELLGRARIHADGGPGDVALRRKHALPGTDCAGRHAIHPGLRDRAANADRKSTCLNSSHTVISY